MYFTNKKNFSKVFVEDYGKEKVRFMDSDGTVLVRSRRVFDKWFARWN